MKENYKGLCSGLFILKDINNNELVHNHNMIVKSGRKQIKESGFPKSNLVIFLSADSSLTEPSMVLSADGKVNGKDIYEVILEDADITSNDDELYVKITKTINDGNIDIPHGKYTSAGLIFNNDTGEKVLLSRLTFPEVNLVENMKYVIEYYIYF